MTRRLNKTLFDYVVIAVIPALIMTLVGSLVFFLLAVLYHSQHEARLHFIFAMFVVATVLIARISMTDGTEYATIFAVPLAIAAALAMFRFVTILGSLASFSWLINLSLLAIVWWSAHKLTWDCTLIDEHQDASGKGLLQTVGLAETSPADERPNEEDQRSHQPPPGTTSRELTPQNLWQRFVEHQRRPHAPGVWVVYYSLAALPLFGFGQWFIPYGELEVRRYAFQLLAVYVASGLALLLTTSFLGLRRYLRQRGVEMTVDVARSWLTVGAIMIVTLMVFCALLPRPGAEYSISQLPIQFGAPDELSTSRIAPGNDGPRDEQRATRTRIGDKNGDNRRVAADQAIENDADDASVASARGNRQQSRGQNDHSQQRTDSQNAHRREDTSPDQGQPHASASQGQLPRKPSSTPRPAQHNGSGGQAESHANHNAKQETGRDESDREKPINKTSDAPDVKTHTDSQQRGPARKESENAQQRGQTTARSSANDDHATGGSPRRTFLPHGSRWLGNLGSMVTGLLKMLFYLAVLTSLAYLAWRNWEQLKAAWAQILRELQNLWRRLFGGREDGETDEPAPTPQPGPIARPFSEFADPFASGKAVHSSLAELIRYSFEALEAWARERGCARDPEQTPLEFARHVAECEKSLGPDARNLASLYSRVAYAQGGLPASSATQLKRLWCQLRPQK